MATAGRTRPFPLGYLGLDAASMTEALADKLLHVVGKDGGHATPRDWLHAVAYAVRDRLIERALETERAYAASGAKRVYYLSMEYLLGRSLGNALLNLDFEEETRRALAAYGRELAALEALEEDAALGNGGLGRLAACILDSMATLRLPGYGYGIRYEYGLFRQRIENGEQVEYPESWLRYGNPWEFPRPECLHPVRFGGRVESWRDEAGRLRFRWVGTEEVIAMAYDVPVPGWSTNTVNILRLWSAKASRELDLRAFNAGDYVRAVERKIESEKHSAVLYPDDSTERGRELRLRQEYFFASATVQDILARFLEEGRALTALPDHVAIQLNDTHPALAIVELLRLLLDEHGLDWDTAWELTRRTCSYTNHTLLPEALERWPVELFERLLPRHLQLVYEINRRFLEDVNHRHPGDVERLRALSLIDEEPPRSVRMAHLAVVGSHRVNGVAELHSRLLRTTVFRGFAELWPERFTNVTNGVTPRRWLHHANRPLARLISGRIGRGWVADLDQLGRLEPAADDPEFRAAFREAKRASKERLAGLVRERLGIAIDPASLYDVQVKRIHEYKRQLLNVLHVVTLYNRLRGDAHYDPPPRTVIFAGKAAPGYHTAKLVIRLIHDVAAAVNADPAVRGRLRVVFVPNYDVTTAEDIIPAADLSEQISTAGTEASGTGCMKLGLNGALLIGTLDGANIEIREAVGADNVFVFGLDAEGAAALRAGGYNPRARYEAEPELKLALDMIRGGHFSPGDPGRYAGLVEGLLARDPYLVLADYADYVACQERVSAAWRDADGWSRRAVLTIARMGRFSIDRAVREYAERVWGTRPVPHE
ncbi:MAG TPA: glycogen/starch/alpha-glucan phosphorylase [Chromatiales bacterium]|nr:glycogen/starch/alpha-glucan phosphorylase [Chromatiales bacterium]